MMKDHYFTRHWVAAVAISVLMCVVGLVSIRTLAIEQYPDIAPPIVTIEASYSGADAVAVMKSVVMPIEEVVNGVENMMYMISTTSSNGDAEIDVYFKQGTDADAAAVNVQNRVSQALEVLPGPVTKAGVTVKKNVSAILTIMSLESVDGKFDEQFISNFIDIKVMPAITRIKGVGRTKIMGEQYGVRIWLKPDLMGLYGVTPDEIVDAINEQNLVAPIGSLESTTDKIDIEFNGLLNDMSDFENIVVRASKSGEMLKLKDVATVELGAKSYDLRTSIGGHPGTTFFVKQAPGANATQVNKEIRKVIADIEKSLPAGLEFKTLETSDDFLFASMDNVVETLVIAIILVVLVVYFFLQSLKATIIPALSIIVSIIGTFAFIKIAGFSLNLLTLFALVLSIGIVVDNAIVVVEAVMAKLEHAEQHDVHRSVDDALTEVTPACISTTLVFMAVFIPVTFMSGTSGTFFKQFGVTLATSVGLSAVSALTLCPALCALLFTGKKIDGAGFKARRALNVQVRKAYTASYNALLQRYTQAVTRFVKRPLLALGCLLLAVVCWLWLSMRAQPDLVPQEDQGFLLVDAAMAPGTYLNETEEAANKLEQYIRTLDEVQSTAVVTGYSMLNDITSTNYITLMVRLKDWSDRDFYSIADIQDSITQWATVNMPEADVSAFQMPQIPGYGNGSMVSANLQDRTGSGDTDGFITMSDEFTRKLNDRPEIAFASSSYSRDYPKYQLDIDEMMCKRMGVSPRMVLETIGSYLAGSYIGSYIQYGNVYRVMVQAGKEYRMSRSTLNSIFVPVGGRMVPVSQFVTLTPTMGSSQEFHFNLFPCYPVTTMPAPGYTGQDVRRTISEVMEEVYPEGYSCEYSGMAREEAENEGSSDTTLIYCICLLLIYLILACLYDSLLIPWAVMLSIPFGLVGAYLFIMPMELMGVGVNIYVQTGIIMLIGMVAKTAILITESAVQRHHEGLSIFDAALEASRSRLRPILMTVAAMIIGMLPLIIKSGAGSVGNKSLALTVVGGMAVGTLALLFVTPSLYIVFQKLQEKLGR